MAKNKAIPIEDAHWSKLSELAARLGTAVLEVSP